VQELEKEVEPPVVKLNPATIKEFGLTKKDLTHITGKHRLNFLQRNRRILSGK